MLTRFVEEEQRKRVYIYIYMAFFNKIYDGIYQSKYMVCLV